MKKIIFTCSFIGLVAFAASAQYFHRYKVLPDHQKPLLKDDTLSFYPEHKFRYSEKLLRKPEKLNEPMKAANIQHHRYDNMPNLKPEGFHHLRIVKPDESVKYSLLIHPPLKLRFSDALSDEAK